MNIILRPNTYLKKVQKGQKHEFIQFEQEDNTLYTQTSTSRLDPDNCQITKKKCKSELQAQLACLETIEEKLNQGYNFYVDGKKKDLQDIRRMIIEKKERLAIRLGSPVKRRNPYETEKSCQTKRSPVSRELFKQTLQVVEKKKRKSPSDDMISRKKKKIDMDQEPQDDLNATILPKVEQDTIQEDLDFEISYSPVSTPISTLENLEIDMSQKEMDLNENVKQLEVEKIRLEQISIMLKENEANLEMKSVEINKMMSEMTQRCKMMEDQLEQKKKDFIESLKRNFILILSEFQ